MSEELKPCPFCGVSDDVVINEDEGAFSPSCETCETSPLTGTVGIGWFKTKDDARRAWNTRPIEDALRAKIAELETALQRIVTRPDREYDGNQEYHRCLNIAKEALKKKAGE